MHYKNIEIKGFRGINNLILEDLKDINIFVGKNNCGKTSLLEAIFLLTGISNPQLIVRINQFRDLLIEGNDDLKYIFFNFDYSNELKFKADLIEKDSYRELTIKPTTFFAAEKQIDNKSNNNVFYSSSLSNEMKDEINELTFDFAVKENLKLKRETAKFQLTSPMPTFISPKSYNEKTKGVYVSSVAPMSANLEKQLDDIIKNKLEKDIIDVLQKVDPKIQGITFGKNIIYLDIGLDTRIPLNLSGDGIRRILSIILGIQNAKNCIVLIDEIENGLHFSALKPVWMSIIEATKKFNVQIFITTHNIETLKYLKEAIEENQYSDKDRIACIALHKFNEADIKAYNYNFEKLEYSIEQGIEVR